MIRTMQKLSEALGNPKVPNGDALVALAIVTIEHNRDLESGLKLADDRIGELNNEIDELKNCLDAAADNEADLWLYIHLVLDMHRELREMMKIIGVVARSARLEPRHRCAVVTRLVDNTLARHYDD